MRAILDWITKERAVNLKGSKTEKNLKDAFAGESQANRRYLYFAAKADVEGYNDVSTVFRSTAEGETGHAHGHLEYLETVGDPATGLPIGETKLNLKAAIAGETHEYSDMYPGMAKAAREEGFAEIADWFETLAKAERSHANRFQKALDTHLTADAAVGAGDTGITRGQPAGALASPARLAERRIHRRGRARERARSRLRHLPRLSPLLQPVQFIPHLVRCDRRERRRSSSMASTRRCTGTSSITVTCATCAS